MSATIAQQDLLAILFEKSHLFVAVDVSSGPARSQDDQALANRQIWQELIANLVDLRSLDDDWDGQGAKAPAVELVDSAISLAGWLRDEQVIPAHYAIAGVNGTLHLEWINNQHSIDIEIISPGLAEVCSVNLPDHSTTLNVFRW